MRSTISSLERSIPRTVVEPKPRATGLTLDEIVADHLDYLHHEAFFVVSTTFEVTAYRTLWFGLQYDSETVKQGETVGNGALATVRWYDGEPVGDGHLQGQFTALKDVVGDMIDKGVFTLSTTRQYVNYPALLPWRSAPRSLRVGL